MLALETGQKDFYQDLLERLVPGDHIYRKLEKLLDFSELLKPLHELYSHRGKPGEPLERGFKALLLQFWEDLSDRQLERFIFENNTARWFCGYGLESSTPDHTYFCKLRRRIGEKKLTEIFNSVTEALKRSGHVGNVFHFVDASALRSKVAIWKARDQAIADKENNEKDDDGNPKMNNKNISNYSSDPDARFGCKGKDKFWVGYKRHNRVDMKHGLITKVAVTPANTPDAQALIDEDLCPDQGMVFLDKGYDSDEVNKELQRNACANATIQKNNRKSKNRDLDRWRSAVRMPFEGIFSKQDRHARYRSKPKVMFQATMEALATNLKRMLQIESGPLDLSTLS